MTNYSSGHAAEDYAATYLEQQGYKIVAKNWRTRYCEIDIVASKNKTLFFVEVKYRTTTSQGSGFDYITPSKLRRMRFAAAFWVAENHWDNDYTLSAIEISGPGFTVSQFLPYLL